MGTALRCLRRGGQRMHVGTNTSAALPTRPIHTRTPFMALHLDSLAAALVMVVMHLSALVVMMRDVVLPVVCYVPTLGMLHPAAMLAVFALSFRHDIRFSRIV